MGVSIKRERYELFTIFDLTSPEDKDFAKRIRDAVQLNYKDGTIEEMDISSENNRYLVTVVVNRDYEYEEYSGDEVTPPSKFSDFKDAFELGSSFDDLIEDVLMKEVPKNNEFEVFETSITMLEFDNEREDEYMEEYV